MILAVSLISWSPCVLPNAWLIRRIPLISPIIIDNGKFPSLSINFILSKKYLRLYVPVNKSWSFKYSISYGSEYVTLTWRGATSAFSHRCEYHSNTPPTPFRIIEPDGFAYSARRDCAHIDKGDFDQFTIRTKDLDYAPYFEEIVIRIWPGTNECDAMSRIGSLPPTSEQPLPVRLSYYFGSCKWN